MSDEEPPSSAENAARANYLLARTISIGINAITVGLIATAFFAVFLLWLQRHSGIELEKGQYGGALVFILVLVTLCAYLVFEYFQGEKERVARERKAAARKKNAIGKPKTDPNDWGAVLEDRLKAFDPLFKDDGVKEQPPAPPAPPPAPEPPQTGVVGDIFETKPTVSDAPGAALLSTAPVSTAPTKDPTLELFVQSVNAGVASMGEELSPFMHFGVQLFVAGGAGELVKRGKVPQTQGKQVLTGMLVDLGLSKRSAEAIAGNANTFAQVPHFRAPIDAGYRAMAFLVEKGIVDMSTLSDALNFWRMQDELCSTPELMTFVTTSVAVPPPGTVVAPEDRQRVLRTHKMVITEVLHRFQGREIHNLGNGSVMVFDDTTRAIRAAMMCQEELDKFARANPAVHVAARIGIDTEIAAVVAQDYVSAALPRTVTISTIAPPWHIYCTQAAKNDALEVIEFAPTTLNEMYADLAPLFDVAWNRGPEGINANPLEWRQVGVMADAP